jgi:tol-pal system protein YbgF
LCLSLLSIGLLSFALSNPASAQADELQNRLRRIENELDTLNRAVYRGDKAADMPAPLTSTEPTSGGNTEIRLQQIENQLRELTGKLEQQGFDIQQIQTQMDRLEAQSKTDREDRPPASIPPLADQPPSVGLNPNGLKPEDSALPGDPPDVPSVSAPAESMKTLTPQKGSDPASLYEMAYGHLKSGNHDQAEAGFNDFIKQYPDHALSANAMYWLGESYYVQGQFDQASKTFAQAYQKYPGGPKGADNLLKLGMSLSGTGKKKEACIALSQVAKEYPNGPAPVLRKAEQEMATLDCR